MSAAEATNDAISAARFKSYDKDSDGTMDVSEVKELMVAMGFAADDAYATTALKKFDADGDGTLTAAEFGPLFEFLKASAAAAAGGGDGPESGAGSTAGGGGGGSGGGEGIGRFDADGSGTLDSEEVGAMLTRLGFDADEGACRNIIDSVIASLTVATDCRLHEGCDGQVRQRRRRAAGRGRVRATVRLLPGARRPRRRGVTVWKTC